MVTETNRIEYAARLAMVDLGAEPTLPSSGVHWTSKTVISAFLAAVGLLLIEVFSPVDFDKTR